MRRLSALVAVLVLGLSTAAVAQTAAPEVEIVDINGSRYAEGGQTQMVVEFRNLPEAPDPAQLSITVDGQPVSDVEVAPLGESSVPVGVVLVIDTSGSMLGAPMDAAKSAANSFIDQKRPEDTIAIVSFADTAVVQTGFTANVDVLHEKINALVADGETAFNDGVILGMSLFDGTPENQLNNMIVLSDGEDTISTATPEEAIAAVEAGDARVFGVALESPDFNPDAVAAVATAGGGLFLSTPDPAQLSGLYSQISREISNTLVARFVSPVAAPGEAEFAVSYPGGLTSTVSVPVSGYATTTTVAPTTTTVPVPITGSVVESNSPMSITNLALIAAAGIGLTAFLFIVILFGRDDDQGGGRFAKRLQAYGRRSRTGETEKKPFLQRLPDSQQVQPGCRGGGAQARVALRGQCGPGAGQHPDDTGRSHPRHVRALRGRWSLPGHLQVAIGRVDHLRGASSGLFHADEVRRQSRALEIREAAP